MIDRSNPNAIVFDASAALQGLGVYGLVSVEFNHADAVVVLFEMDDREYTTCEDGPGDQEGRERLIGFARRDPVHYAETAIESWRKWNPESPYYEGEE